MKITYCVAMLLAFAGCGTSGTGGTAPGYGESAAPGLAADMLNPQRPQAKPAYIYVKPPPKGARAGQRLVLYESHTAFGNGVNVGFMDGHVEYVSNQKYFNDLLQQASQDSAGPGL